MMNRCRQCLARFARARAAMKQVPSPKEVLVEVPDEVLDAYQSFRSARDHYVTLLAHAAMQHDEDRA
ncbi:MAG: hypothetical protein HY548_10295 [Elusimicrobia bacterium]|nr:hypothetical protein [Elusimicrobiota bacterium]